MNRIINIKRGNEQNSNADIPSRANRFFKFSDNWYYTTREGVSMGPYHSHELAEKSSDDYIAFVSEAAPHVLKLLTPNLQVAHA